MVELSEIFVSVELKEEIIARVAQFFSAFVILEESSGY